MVHGCWRVSFEGLISRFRVIWYSGGGVLFGGVMRWDHEKGQILKGGILVAEEHGLFPITFLVKSPVQDTHLTKFILMT